ncbi:hypothetical protein Dthio_PD0692 [Desulfonatronospira thiodismutans ASO3-1]|uniref:Uncharacterized protein n=1 Tax=Desulfonatronospira thiodismutans ASO3-1 TaxID=555779 RepID=D6SRP8_9BACT|nr:MULTISPECIES: hypothetical protein [Desulfonatronospira]EFI33364.1 hypothetical protein Dthio_PD0692 [Desulfonatronospira thiodismutans ASO3-1]RQD78852.1 MAG: hypothetical protein D5S03_01310 [Desulfonatronospira sp. MSAO_Bac3]
MKWLASAAAKRSLGYIAFTVPVLGLLIVLGVMPVREDLTSQEQEKARLQAEIKRQEVFQPLYAEIMQRREEPEPPDAVKDHHRDIADAPSIDVIADRLGAMAADSGLDNISFSPVPQSLDNDSGLLLVNGQMQGPLQNFRELLLRLAGTEAFEGLEDLEIHGTESLPRYSLSLWVRL